jgi:low temperature requirement protein LtrA
VVTTTVSPMTEIWRRPMRSRDASEEHRASTPLELLYDLCFVVAIARAATLLHHAISHGDIGSAVVSYVLVFFAIWWAWMNFTWFASAYDNDDAVYRVLVFVQMAGVLILAAGVPRAFEHRDFDIVFVGYIVMRAGLVTLWLRAAHHDPHGRTIARRYAAGVSLALVGWAGVALLGWPVWAFFVMGVFELLVPAWSERPGETHTPWHPEHIAERYGLFTIIVLGETILSSSIAFQAVVDERTGDVTAVLTAVGALLTVFSMWWIYFAKPAGSRLVSNRVAFPWGYGHFVVFASAAAVGAGVAVVVDDVTGNSHLDDIVAAAAFTVPVILYVLAVTFIHTLLYGLRRDYLSAMLVVMALVAGATFTGQPVLLTGIVMAASVATTIVMTGRTSH